MSLYVLDNEAIFQRALHKLKEGLGVKEEVKSLLVRPHLTLDVRVERGYIESIELPSFDGFGYNSLPGRGSPMRVGLVFPHSCWERDALFSLDMMMRNRAVVDLVLSDFQHFQSEPQEDRGGPIVSAQRLRGRRKR
jgi:hypothetical protein